MGKNGLYYFCVSVSESINIRLCHIVLFFPFDYRKDSAEVCLKNLRSLGNQLYQAVINFVEKMKKIKIDVIFQKSLTVFYYSRLWRGLEQISVVYITRQKNRGGFSLSSLMLSGESSLANWR